ncbi:MAG: GDP-L-fucose synthase [Hyphomonadaceae bacterium]
MNKSANTFEVSPKPRPEKIYIAGHRGMVGSAILRKLLAAGHTNILTRTRAELDLVNQQAVSDFLQDERPDYIIIAAAKVGGILANDTERGAFLYENLMIEANLIHAAWQAGIGRLLFLGSSCIYPREATQPISESALLTGPLEQTNEPYAIAKIAGIKLCENYNRQYGTQYVSVMPTNMYGPNDNYDLQTSHVLPALLRKAHEAKLADKPTLTLWGSGRPRREFMHVDDMAEACIFIIDQGAENGVFNIGTGDDVSITELAELVCETVGFKGTLEYDRSKPDGTFRKRLDVTAMTKLGWTAQISLKDGLASTYDAFKANYCLDDPTA